MRCIFCKQNSELSKSVEHILPESLGNTKHVLRPGWVCDSCNNYISREIERPFLKSAYMLAMRFTKRIPSKKGNIPPIKSIDAKSGCEIEMRWSLEDGLSVNALKASEESHWINYLRSADSGRMYFPAPVMPCEGLCTSRFIAKVGLEVLASRVADVPNSNTELVKNPQHDELRRFVRFGVPKTIWPVAIRKLYEHDHVFDDGNTSFELLNEWTILVTETMEYYAVIAIFGVEYAINLGGPELSGYHNWLQRNNWRSPLIE